MLTVQHVLTAAGTNVVRISQHRPGRKPPPPHPTATAGPARSGLTTKITNSIRDEGQIQIQFSAVLDSGEWICVCSRTRALAIVRRVAPTSVTGHRLTLSCTPQSRSGRRLGG